MADTTIVEDNHTMLCLPAESLELRLCGLPVVAGLEDDVDGLASLVVGVRLEIEPVLLALADYAQLALRVPADVVDGAPADDL